MKVAILALLLAGCGSKGADYITYTTDMALFCFPPEVGVVEYECGYMAPDEETGARTRRVCPRGYIHRPDRINTCRRSDMPIPKVVPR